MVGIRAGRCVGPLVMVGAVVAAACGPSGSATPNADEMRLANGVRLDLAGNCDPHRDDLPAATIVAIQCSTGEEDVGIRLYLFNRQEELLHAYLDMLEDAGLEPRMDAGSVGGVEGAYYTLSLHDALPIYRKSVV